MESPASIQAEGAQGQRILAGIDEAGLGPVLGPLAIGYCVFAVPSGMPMICAISSYDFSAM